MRHLLALYIRAGGRLVFSTGSDCCSNFSAYWVLEQFQRCWGCSGSLVAIIGLFHVPGGCCTGYLYRCSARRNKRGYAGRYRGELESCPILLLFSSLVFRASPRTAFERSMQAKARGLLPRIRVVALKAFLFMREYSTAWACFSQSWIVPRPFPYAGKSRAGGRLQCPQLRNVCLKFPQLVQSIVEYDI